MPSTAASRFLCGPAAVRPRPPCPCSTRPPLFARTRSSCPRPCAPLRPPPCRQPPPRTSPLARSALRPRARDRPVLLCRLRSPPSPPPLVFFGLKPPLSCCAAPRRGRLPAAAGPACPPLWRSLAAGLRPPELALPRACVCVARRRAGFAGLALLRLREMVEADPSGALAGWDEADASPCFWFGVECSDDGRVVGLILLAMLTVFERVGDNFISWLPMYSEAKHESEIGRNLLELRTRASDMAVVYFHKVADYSQTRFHEILQYIASQSQAQRSRSQAR